MSHEGLVPCRCMEDGGPPAPLKSGSQGARARRPPGEAAGLAWQARPSREGAAPAAVHACIVQHCSLSGLPRYMRRSFDAPLASTSSRPCGVLRQFTNFSISALAAGGASAPLMWCSACSRPARPGASPRAAAAAAARERRRRRTRRPATRMAAAPAGAAGAAAQRVSSREVNVSPRPVLPCPSALQLSDSAFPQFLASGKVLVTAILDSDVSGVPTLLAVL